MTRTLAGLAVALGLVSAGLGLGRPAQITATTPFGVRRGVGHRGDDQRDATWRATPS